MPKEIEIESTSASWVVKAIGEISEKVSVGYVGLTSEHFTDSESGVPLLRSQNIRNGKLNLENMAYVTKDFHQANRKSNLQPAMF